MESRTDLMFESGKYGSTKGGEMATFTTFISSRP